MVSPLFAGVPKHTFLFIVPPVNKGYYGAHLLSATLYVEFTPSYKLRTYYVQNKTLCKQQLVFVVSFYRL